MTTKRLILGSLVHYWRQHLALMLCVTTGTAVLTGALLVGDSMRGSLRQLTLGRLARVDHALHAGRYFREVLATELNEHDDYRRARLGESVPAINLRGSIARVDSSGQESLRAGRVQVWGVPQAFWYLGRRGTGVAPAYERWSDGPQFRDAVVLSANLAHDLGVGAGDEVLARVELPSEIPREAMLGRKADTIRTLRLRVTDIADRDSMGGFGLEPTQHSVRNAFIPLTTLQSALGLADRANVILTPEPTDQSGSAAVESRLADVLAEQWRLEDIGLRLRVDEARGYVSLESGRMVLEPAVAAAAGEAASVLKLQFSPALVYLANSIESVPSGSARRNQSRSGYSVVELVASPLSMVGTAVAGAADSYRARRRHSIPYSIVAAVPHSVDSPFALPEPASGGDIATLADDEILLNSWAVEDLGAQVGDWVDITYFVAEPSQPFETSTARFRVRGVLPIEGAAADPGVVPKYPGITNARTYADWDPPFPMDLKRVRPKDEEYWDEYRTTPKAFVSLRSGEKLWSSRFGKWTSVRFAPAAASVVEGRSIADEGMVRQGSRGAGELGSGELAVELGRGGEGEQGRATRRHDLSLLGRSAARLVPLFPAPPLLFSPAPPLPRSPASPAGRLDEVRAQLERELLQRLRPEQFGLAFRPVKAEGLEAARGGTDFGQLFLAFSFFLIASAAILIALVFRLGVERRAKQIGLLLALGINPASLRWILFMEGLAVAAVGSVVGLGGAVGYAWLVMAGLRNWWLPAVGTSLLKLHVPASTLAIGAMAGMALAAVATAAALRGLVRLAPSRLLAGASTDPLDRTPGVPRRPVWSLTTAFVSLAGAVLLLPGAVLWRDSPALFFGIGTALLVSCLGFLAATLGRDDGRLVRGRGASAVARLGVRNARRHRGRSVLTASLVACATFVIVAVGANRREDESHAGAGRPVNGFLLVAESAVPLLHNLNTPAGRAELGLPHEASEQLAVASVFSFRVKEGDDASCLNLYQPRRPRILGAGAAMLARGGFRIAESQAKTPEEERNPWRLLERKLDPGVIPTIGDANSVRWILKLGLGDRLKVTAEDGREAELQIVALLDRSIFQSELVISESNFRQIFPSQAGFSYFLIAQSEEHPESNDAGRYSSLPGNSSLGSLLEEHLSDFGFDAMPISERLAEYHAVENTYLSTFQTLGGLGLVLGTLGLGAVLLRNVLERRGELALLLAVGFRPIALVGLVLAENLFLLIGGVVAGTASALVAVAPHVSQRAAELPWASLAGTLGVVIVAGVASAAAAVLATLRTPLLPALRSE